MSETVEPGASDDSWGFGLWQEANLVTPMAIRVAATLRVADHIVAGHVTVADLAAVTRSDPDALGRLLQHLVSVGILTGGPDGYGVTERGAALRDDHPHGVRQWLALNGAVGRADLSFVALLHTVRTGQPAYPEFFGTEFWHDLSDDPALSASFDALMSAQIIHGVGAIAATYDWESVGHAVDVGGGDGSLLIALLGRYPRMRGTLVDLAGPTASASAKLTDAGLDRRCTIATGSFFDPLPPGADAYVLSAIIHDWDDEPACAILRRCAEAAGQRGRVLVIEAVGEDGESPNTEMDLRMLAYGGGRERGMSEYTALAERSGLRIVDVHPAPPRSIIELRR